MAKRIELAKTPLRMLIYGLPGSTKTRTALSGAIDPRLQPMIYLNARGNPESCEEYVKGNDQVVLINVDQLEDFNDPYTWIISGQKQCKWSDEFNLSGYPPFQSILIDTLTQTQRMMFDKVMGTTRMPAKIVSKREWDHYNKVLYSMINFAQSYYDLPIHVIMTAQEREGDVDSERPVGPMLEGQSQVEVPSYALIVARMRHVSQVEPAMRKVMEKDGAQNVAIFKPTTNMHAKDQQSNGRLGDLMINPTMTKIMDAVYPASVGLGASVRKE